MEGPRKTGKEKISRRDFLKGIASIAATTASVAEIGEVHLRIPDFQILKKERDARRRFERFDGLNAQEREKIITREAEEFGAFIRSKEGTRILESGTDEELSALLSNMPAILREHVKGTTYDIDPHHWPSTIVNVGEWKKFVPHIDPTHRDREAVQKSIGDKRFGNGFFIDDETLITNKHVVSAAFPYFRKYLQPYPDSDEKREALAQMETIQSRTDATGVDITTLKAPKVDAETERTIVKITDITNDDLHGRLVRTAAIKPDETAADDGTKMYVSVAIKITPHLQEFLARHIDIAPPPIDDTKETGQEHGREVVDSITRSFLILLPPGEATRHRTPAISGSRLLDKVLGKPDPTYLRDLHVSGTSGSPVLMDDRVVGINHRVTNIAVNDLCLDIGYFHGPDELREAIKDHQRRMPTEFPADRHDSNSQE